MAPLSNRTWQADTSYRFGFNGQEKDNEIAGRGNINTAEFWEYDTRSGRRWNADPMENMFPWQSPYIVFNDRPITSIDHKGDASEVIPPGNGNAASAEGTDPAGSYVASQTTREAAFAVNHPEVALKNGLVISGSLNIATVSARFAASIGLIENMAREGSQVNAVRHTLWQAILTRDFGAGIATEAGNAHEDDPNALANITDPSKQAFRNLAQADQAIDLLNNQIGRQIGVANPKATTKELAAKTLDYYKEHGLWTAVAQSDGTYKIAQTKLANDEYIRVKAEVQNKNEFGYTSQQWQQRIDEANKWAEQQKSQLLIGPKF